ncbi:MAG TPA: nucleotide pyrophosphohydrolase [Vicinamibacterales bacterium]|mgnify:CR=1 FL=1|nr:nucleotide pyrophosphohydrolase [Vicinamibacterales bacterium]
MSDDRWALGACVDRLLAFRKARDWEQFHRPKELAAALAIEAGELQEQFLWKPEETAQEVREDAARLGQIRDEVADVAIYALLLAHDLNIDLAGAIAKKIASNERRYPANSNRGVARKAGNRAEDSDPQP